MAAAQWRARSATSDTSAASAGMEDLPLLHGSQLVTRLSGASDPPRATGMTWSIRSETSGADAPQYRQVWLSRRRISYRRRLETAIDLLSVARGWRAEASWQG